MDVHDLARALLDGTPILPGWQSGSAEVRNATWRRIAYSYDEAHRLWPLIEAHTGARVAELEKACEDAHDALLSARAFILKKHGSTNPAREASIAELRRLLDARQALGESQEHEPNSGH